jgi:hypothetical protein
MTPPSNTPDERDQTIAELRAALKAKDDEIADLARDRNRFEGRLMFANAGSALRAPTLDDPRRFPCPTCHEPDCLTAEDQRIGYQCDSCADRAEGRGGYG